VRAPAASIDAKFIIYQSLLYTIVQET
jgi:hypothetical protein